MLSLSELLFTAAISVLLNGEYRTLPSDWWVRALFALIRVLFLKWNNGRRRKVIYTKVHTVYTLNDAQSVLKGPKCVRKSAPPSQLHRPLIQGRMDSCFHVVYTNSDPTILQQKLGLIHPFHHLFCTQGCEDAGVYPCHLRVKAGFTQDESPV